MPRKDRLSMRKIKEVLRLKYELKLSNRQIAKSCSIPRVTVANYLSRRTRPMVCFVNIQSVDRMIFSIFNRFNQEWQNRTLRVFTQAA